MTRIAAVIALLCLGSLYAPAQSVTIDGVPVDLWQHQLVVTGHRCPPKTT